MAELRRCTDCGTFFDARCNVCLQTKAIKEAAKQQADATNQVQWARESAEREAESDRRWAVESARKQAEKAEWDRLNPNPALKFDVRAAMDMDYDIAAGKISAEAARWLACLEQYNALKPDDARLIDSVWREDMKIWQLRSSIAHKFRNADGDIELFPKYLELVKENIESVKNSLDHDVNDFSHLDSLFGSSTSRAIVNIIVVGLLAAVVVWIF